LSVITPASPCRSQTISSLSSIRHSFVPGMA
jgi:hypothetical protein